MTLLAKSAESKKIYDRAQRDSRKWDPRLEKTSKVACGTYRVEGRHGTYTVIVSAAGFSCNCIAGINQTTCWHVASAYRMRLVEKMNRPLEQAESAPEPLYSLVVEVGGELSRTAYHGPSIEEAERLAEVYAGQAVDWNREVRGQQVGSAVARGRVFRIYQARPLEVVTPTPAKAPVPSWDALYQGVA